MASLSPKFALLRLDSRPLRLERVISPSTLEFSSLRIASVPQLVFFKVARDMDWAIASAPFDAWLLTGPVRQAIVTTFAQVSAPVRVVPCPSMNRQACPKCRSKFDIYSSPEPTFPSRLLSLPSARGSFVAEWRAVPPLRTQGGLTLTL